MCKVFPILFTLYTYITNRMRFAKNMKVTDIEIIRLCKISYKYSFR